MTETYLTTNFLLWVHCSGLNSQVGVLIPWTFLETNSTNGPLWNSFSHLISKFIKYFSKQFHTMTNFLHKLRNQNPIQLLWKQLQRFQNDWSKLMITTELNQSTYFYMVRALVVNALQFRNTLLLHWELIF